MEARPPLIYVVLGMHKSGTTLVARMLHRSGIDMGEDLDATRSYDEGEKFERASTKAINEAILGSHGKHSLAIAPLPPGTRVDEALRAEMRRVVERCQASAKDWGFKDPRTCLTYAVWAEALPEHRRIVVFRRPEGMWRRYRPWQRARVPERAYRLLQRWCEHYGAVLEHAKEVDPATVVVDYDRLMREGGQLVRLARFVGRELVDERRPELTRGGTEDYPALHVARHAVRLREGYDAVEIAARLECLARRPVPLVG